MATLTSRLKLRKPASTDVVNVDTDLSGNFDAIDSAIGFEPVTSGTRPATPYIGQQIYETDTGYTYMWVGSWIRIITDDTPPSYRTGFRNYIRNGNNQVWQRGNGAFTFTGGVAGYGADGWLITPGAGATCLVTKSIIGPGQNTDPFFHNWQRTVTGTASSYMSQRIENGAKRTSGQTVTLSFNCYSGVLIGPFNVSLRQNFGTGGAPSAAVQTASQPFNADANNSKVSLTFVLPSVAGKTFGTNNDDYLEVIFEWPTSTANGVLGTWDVQLEDGPVATPFERRPQAVELAICQRYYYRTTANATATSLFFGNAVGTGTTAARATIRLPVTMRIPPTAIDQDGTAAHYSLNNGATNVALSAVPVIAPGLTNENVVALTLTTASGLVAGTYYDFIDNGFATAYIGVNAEL